MRQDGTESTEETSPIVTFTEVRDEEIRRFLEVIWCGNRRLCEINEEWARLEKKSATLDEEISKIQMGVAQTSSANV